MKTILETLDGGTQWLEKKGVEDARRNMQLIMCYQLGCSKIQLYTRFDKPLLEDHLGPMREMLKQRGKGVPIQHLLGTVEFFRREFKIDDRALIPRPETEELVEHCLAALPKEGDLRILDMGCGSGIIGLSLAAELGTRAQLVCADTSAEALTLTKENIALLKLENVTILKTDLFSNTEGEFDLIVANLPYVPKLDRPSLAPELAHDPDLALFGGKDGLDIIREFIQKSPAHLKNNSTVALEISIHQSSEVESLLTAAGFQQVTTKIDINGIARFPMATYIP